MRQEEAPDGSRVTVTYNAPLSDYSAYRRGDRFVVVIPKADAPSVRSNLRGRGFDGVQVERRGEDAVLSFRIRPGTKARVDQQFNRLDVVFTAPERPSSSSGQTTAAPSQSSAAKASQTNQWRSAGTPQAPLANHNSTADATAQANNLKPGGEMTVTADSTAAQAGSMAGTPAAQSPSTSNGASVPHATPQADETATASPAPALSPTASSLSPGTVTVRYWLLLLTSLLLLTGVWAIIAKRRRSPERKGKSTRPEPAEVTETAEAEALAEAETVALLLESPEEPALVPADTQPAEDEARQNEAEEMEVETAALPASDGPTAELVEVGQAGFDESPAPPATDGSGLPDRILKYLGSEDVNERSAGVLGLADFMSDEAFGRIGAAFDDPSQQVRDAAARSLFNLSTDRAASFKRLMRDASPERRRRVGEAIASSGMAGEALSDLSSESGERAYDALLVLSLMARSGEVRSLIETIEEHPSTEVRLAIVKLLALSGRQEILHAFRYLSTRDSLPIAVRSSIMEAIYQLNNPQSFPLQTT